MYIYWNTTRVNELYRCTASDHSVKFLAYYTLTMYAQDTRSCHSATAHATAEPPVVTGCGYLHVLSVTPTDMHTNTYRSRES